VTANYETVGLALFASAALLPMVPVIIAAYRHLRAKESDGRRRSRRRLRVLVAVASAIYAVVVIDAYLIEPNRPEVIALELHGNVQTPLRILHLSDLHLEEHGAPREGWLLRQLKTLNPDIILLTGDIHQMENFNVEVLRPVLAELTAPLGVYACLGYDNRSVLQEAAPGIIYLENKALRLRHDKDELGLIGMVNVGRHGPLYEEVAEADYRIAMNHTPDLAQESADAGMDLYLCGHTHGGQVRIPLWGALITNTGTGKKYEAGHYREGEMDIYTSRGLGLEPPPAPQVRFLCRPEITLITIHPKVSE
jgi:predicted MPP superfamily phosphohydrolase